MSVLTVKQIKEMPAMPIPGVAGTLVEVKEYKPVPNGARGPTTVQQFKIQDGQDWIFGDAWGMQDISPWRGKHVIFLSNKTGNNKMAGVSIKEKPSQDGSKTYKNLSLSGACTMHDKDTYEQSRGAAPTPAPASQPAAPFVPKPAVAPAQQDAPLPSQTSQAFNQWRKQPTLGQIQGVTVGMAINNAIHILIATKGFEDGGFGDKEFNLIHRIASGIIGVSQRLERGELAQDNPDPVDSVVTVTRVMNSQISATNLPGYTQADTAGIESFENAIPKPRPKPTPGPGGSAFPSRTQEQEDEDVPF